MRVDMLVGHQGLTGVLCTVNGFVIIQVNGLVAYHGRRAVICHLSLLSQLPTLLEDLTCDFGLLSLAKEACGQSI